MQAARKMVRKITAGLNKGRPSAGEKAGPYYVIAGWYRAVAETEWQKSFVPYLVPAGLNKGLALKLQGQAFLRPIGRLRLQSRLGNWLEDILKNRF